ncbi:hypothetical protein MYX82_08575 [Acidobacteria bacterium AH-259-D05]|nr:hypothetical protein [Acidobacteria bacterium AH-259-D05]
MISTGRLTDDLLIQNQSRRRPMETFHKLFGSLLSFVYHCLDRVVILAYLPLLTREENIVHFFRDVNGIWPITPEALRERTNRYRNWVDSYARQHQIPIEWAQKGVRKEDYVRPYLQRMQRRKQFGVYCILRSMEVGPTFRCSQPRYPVEDPGYRILRRQRSRYTHFYFYIHDPVLGAMSLCIGSFVPFQINCYLNGHSFMERELIRRGIGYRKNDNAFLAVDDPEALQHIADSLDADLIQARLDHWIDELGPRFSARERQALWLRRQYSIQQLEYCRNLIFRRNFPIHKLFERSCDIGLYRLSADKISQIFGFRLHRRFKGKLVCVLDNIEHGHHVLRAGCKKALLRMYEKFSTFLRLEVLSNDLREFGLKKSLHHLDTVRKTLAGVADRFAAFEAEALNVQVDFPLFQRLALPILSGHSRIPGIKIHDTRMIRLMQVLMHAGPTITGWRTPRSTKESSPVSASQPKTTP